MSDIVSDGLRIHYEVDGAGPWLVLQHGFAMSARRWREAGYVEGLSDHYTCILIDARGHGESDKPHDPALYTPELMARDIIAVLDTLGAERAHFWGYSMGGSLARFVARTAPERLLSLVMGGSAPAPPAREPRVDPLVSVLREGMAAYVRTVESRGEALAPEARRAFLANDASALIALREGMAGVESALSVSPVRTLLYAGEMDPVCTRARAYAEELKGAEFFVLPGLNHPAAFARTELVLPRVRQFLDAQAVRQRV